jgi:glycosyltransferase involved in cell wall biosynthesis
VNIVFYANHKYWGGLANNGGSRTILLSANVLRGLGHKVDVLSHTDKFTWFEHPPVIDKLPQNTDVVIAVSISDVPEIMKKCSDKKLAYWARPFEFWQEQKGECLKILKKFNGKIMCNSEWQTTWLKKHGIDSQIVYSGQDISNPVLKEKHNTPVVVGVQYSTKPRKGWKEFKNIVNITGNSVKYAGYGSENCRERFFDTYLKNPKRDELAELYKKIDVFVCSSTLEGFYNPGAEAAMAGCVIISNNNKKNGCMDYCDYNTAHIYNTPFEASQSIMHPDYSKPQKMQKLIIDKIGSREMNMKRMVECLK